MSEILEANAVLTGGQFLIRDSRPEDVFIPEQFNEEQLMIKQMAVDFLKTEIDPNRAKIEKQETTDPISFEKNGRIGFVGGAHAH